MDAGQAISGIHFDIDPTASGIKFIGGSAVDIDVTENSGYRSYTNGDTSPVATASLEHGNPSDNADRGSAGGQPSEMIIGPAGPRQPRTGSSTNFISQQL